MGKGIGNRLVSCEPEHRSPRGQCGFNPLAKASSAPSLAAIDSEYGFGLRPLSADIHQLVSWQRQVQCLSLLESVRTLQAGLQSFLSMRRIEARRKNAKAFRLRHSQSLARRRQRLSHAMVRSTIQRFGKTTNSLTPSERLTISMSRCGRTFCNCFRKFRPFISAVDEQRLQKWKHAEQCR